MNKFNALFESLMVEGSFEWFRFKKKNPGALDDMKKNADKAKRLMFMVPSKKLERFPTEDEIEDWVENQGYATIEDWSYNTSSKQITFLFYEYKDLPVKNKIEFGKAFLKEFPQLDPAAYGRFGTDD